MLISNFKQGQISETLFKNLCERDGKLIEKSTRHEDTRLHIDFWVKLKTRRRSVDVKSIKKMNGRLQDDYFYIEMKNNSGKNGWIYAPTMDLVAFECYENFMVFKRKALFDYIKEKGASSFEKRTRHKDSSYCILVPRKDVSHLVYYILHK